MKKLSLKKLLILIPAVLLLAMFTVACGDEAETTPRVPEKHLFSPEGPFVTNINDSDQRSVLRCAIVFEVIDEAAVSELGDYTAAIRNAVLMVLGELTIEEVTTEKNLEDIAQRIVERVNETIGSLYPLVTGAYFTEFVLTRP